MGTESRTSNSSVMINSNTVLSASIYGTESGFNVDISVSEKNKLSNRIVSVIAEDLFRFANGLRVIYQEGKCDFLDADVIRLSYYREDDGKYMIKTSGFDRNLQSLPIPQQRNYLFLVDMFSEQSKTTLKYIESATEAYGLHAVN